MQVFGINNSTRKLPQNLRGCEFYWPIDPSLLSQELRAAGGNQLWVITCGLNEKACISATPPESLHKVNLMFKMMGDLGGGRRGLRSWEGPVVCTHGVYAVVDGSSC